MGLISRTPSSLNIEGKRMELSFGVVEGVDAFLREST